MKNFFSKKKLFFLFLFLGIFFFATYKINPFNGVTSYGDATYFFNSNSISLWHQNLANGLSRENSIFLYFRQNIFCKIFGIFGLSYNWISYLNWLLPILFCFLVYQYIGYRITKNNFFAFILAIFIIFSNSSMEYLIFFPGSYFYAIGILGIYFYISKKIYDVFKITWQQIIVIVLLSPLLTHPFFLLIAMLYWFIFFAFFLYKKYSIESLFKIISVFLGVLLINSYWIIPFAYGLININNVANGVYSSGNIDAVYYGYLQQGKPINIIQNWTYPSVHLFLAKFESKINILVSFFIWCFFVFLLAIKKYKNELVIFLFSVFLIFYSLSFAPNNPLISNIWNYFWDNVGFFNFFRSFSRFSIILFPLLGIIFAILFIQFKWKYKNVMLAILLILLLGSQHYIFTGDLAGTLSNYSVPNNYYLLNEKINQDKNIYSTIAYPFPAYEGYSWNKNRGIDYFPQAYYFKEYFINKNIIYEKAAFNLRSKNDFYKELFPKKEESKDRIPELISLTNAKYVLVQHDLIDILAENRNEIVSSVEYDNFFFEHDFNLIEENENFSLYENKEYLPLIYGKEVFFKKVYDTKYKIILKNVSEIENLDFLVNNNSNWKLYLTPTSTNSWCNPIEYYRNTETTECNHTQKFFEGEELSYLYKKPIFDDTHQLVNDYANGWTIDPDYIKKNYSKKYYKENADGSIDIELTLYFKPQSYFYLGLGVSGITLLSCFGYLAYDWRKKKKRKTIKPIYRVNSVCPTVDPKNNGKI